MRTGLVMIPLLIGIAYSGFSQIKPNKVADKPVKPEKKSIAVEGGQNLLLKDTLIKIRINKKKFDSLLNAKVDLGTEASLYLGNYQSKATISEKTIQKVKFIGSKVVIVYSDGSEEEKKIDEYSVGGKADNVEISYPAAPSEAKLNQYTTSVNNTLETNIRKILSERDWKEYLKMEENLNIYGKIYKRIQLIIVLSQKK